MDNKNVTGGGVKVTYIETQFVTADAAGFKDLVQRLTGRSAPPPPPALAPHRPLPCRPADDGRRGKTRTAAGAGAGPQGYHHYPVTEVRPAAVIGSSNRTPTYLEDMGFRDVIDMGDFPNMFYVGATSERSDACYGSFPY